MKKNIVLILLMSMFLNIVVMTELDITYATEERELNSLKYDYASSFSEGLALVKSNDKYSYIDKEGKEIIPLKYRVGEKFSEGLVQVESNYKYGYIDKKGKEVIPLKYDHADNFSEGLARVKLNYKYGYIDKEGKEVVPLKYDEVRDFSEGLASVKLNTKGGFLRRQFNWGYIDKEGKEVIPLKYDYTDSFSEGLASVELNGKYGYIDKEGKEVFPIKYSYADNFSEGLARVELNDKYGYIDKEGKEIIPIKYSYADSFSEGLALVKSNDKYGYIDKEGKEIIPIKYSYADSFSEGLASIKSNDKYGYIDKEGKEIIALKYDEARDFSEGLASVKLNGKWGFIDKTGELVVLNIDKKEEVSNISLKFNTNSLTIKEGESTSISTILDPSDAVLSYSTSDPWIATVSMDGKVKAHRPGTATISIKATKNEYEETIENINITVEGLNDFNLRLDPKLLILNQGDIRKISSNLASDVKLTEDVSNPSIVDIVMQGAGGRITAKSIGESDIRFIAQKQGYRTDYVDGKIIVLEDNYNSSNIIKQSTSHWYDIPSKDKVTRQVRDKVVQDAETIISSLTRRKISGSNSVITLDRKIIEDMILEAKDIKTQVNQYIKDVSINPSRKINLRLIVESNLDPINNEVSIRLNKNELNNLEDIDNLYTYIKEYGVTIGLDLKTLNQEYINNESITIKIKKDEDSHIIKFINENGEEIESLNQNIILILPVDSINPYQSSVFKQDEDGITQVGGSYDAEQQGISIKTKASGRYYISDKKMNFSDISNKDEEMKKAIEFLASKGIITGQSDVKFNPDGILTRAEFTTMLVKSFYALDTGLKVDFEDVKASDWYHDYVASSQKEDIVKGFDNKTFRPNDNITKEQMIALVSRALVNKKGYIHPEDSDDYLKFLNDSDKIGEWAKKDVALAIRERTMEIPNDFMFNPKGTVTRGEAARVLYRMFLKLY